MQRREGKLTEALRSFRLPFRVIETVRGASPVGGRPELHRKVWTQVVQDDLPGAILLEDGVRLLPGFVGFLAAGGYLHSDLTQLCHGRARVWRWGASDASPGVRLRPLAVSDALPAGYALSRKGADHLLKAHRAARARYEMRDDQWPCEVGQLGALVARPQLVEAPEWMTATQVSRPARDTERASRLRHFAREPFTRELGLRH